MMEYLLPLLLLAAAPSGALQQQRVKVTTLDQKTVSFEKVGLLYAGRDYGHIYASVDLNDLVGNYNRLVNGMDEAQHKALTQAHLLGKPKAAAFANHSFGILREDLHETRLELEFICDVAGCIETLKDSRYSHDQHHNAQVATAGRPQVHIPLANHNDHGQPRRKARQAAFVTGLIAVGISIYNTVEIEMLKGRIDNLEQQNEMIIAELMNEHDVVNDLVDHVKAVEMDLSRVHTWQRQTEYEMGFLKLGSLLRHSTTRLQRYTHAVADVILHKSANLRFFDIRMLQAATSAIDHKARKAGFAPISVHLDDVASGPVSFTSDAGKIFFLLHVPLGRLPALTLYRFVDTPFLLEKGKAVKLAVSSSLIALDSGLSSRVELTSEELQHCLRVKDSFLCHSGLSSKSVDASCLGAVFTGSKIGIQNLCRFKKLDGSRETITQIGPRTVSIYTPPQLSTSVYVSCTTQGPQQIIAKEYVEIELPSDCTLITGHNTFRPELSLHIEERFTARPLALPEITSGLIHSVFEESESVNRSLEFEKLGGLVHLNDTLGSDQSSVHHVATFSVMGAVLAIVIFLSLLLVYIVVKVEKERKRNKRARRQQDSTKGSFKLGPVTSDEADKQSE